MTTDVKIVCEDDDTDYAGTLYLQSEKYTYLLDKNMKVYDFAMFKALSQALGGLIFPNLITDFGQCIENFSIEGVITEPTRHESELKMMEIAHFIRIKSFNAANCYLYIGEDEDNPDTDLYYAVKADADRLLVNSSKGIPVKISKCQFEHIKNRYDIAWKMDLIVGIDLEFTQS